MTFDEANVLIDQFNKDYQNNWEQTRWLGYINAVCAGNKINKPSDLMMFSWEQSEIIELQKEDIEQTKNRLLEMMKRV